MSATDLIQLFLMVGCLLTIVIWWGVGRNNARLVYLRWVVIVPSLITGLFYALVLFTTFNEEDPALAALISALIRMYTQLLFLIGGLVMLITYRNKLKP